MANLGGGGRKGRLKVKRCSRCKKEQRVGRFYWHNRTKGKRSSWCKRCEKAWKQSHAGRVSQAKRNTKAKARYRVDAEYRAKKLKASSEWYARVRGERLTKVRSRIYSLRASIARWLDKARAGERRLIALCREWDGLRAAR